MQPTIGQIATSAYHSWSDLRAIALRRPLRGSLTRDNFAQRLNWPTNVWCGRCHTRGGTVEGLAHYPGCAARDRDIRFRLTGQNRLTAELGRILSPLKRKPKTQR